MGKISNYTAFFEKCGYLLSANYFQPQYAKNYMISVAYHAYFDKGQIVGFGKSHLNGRRPNSSNLSALNLQT
jgi:hypothetical protein